MYRGFVPNAVKNLPNKGIRLGTFDAAKALIVASQVAYADEVAKRAAAAKEAGNGKAKAKTTNAKMTVAKI